jgi:hypothetical protein
MSAAIRAVKRTAHRRRNSTFNWNIKKRRLEENDEGKLKFILLIIHLQNALFIIFKKHVTYLHFFFRSRSYPVPQRGERVKQRTVHTRS